MATTKRQQKWGSLELPITSWQVLGLVLLAGIGLSTLLVLGTFLLVAVSPQRFEQILALLKIVLKTAVP